MLFGILNCVDRNNCNSKAIGLYDILQEGGMSTHTGISASDKDLFPTFKQMCSLVTIDVMGWTCLRVGELYDSDEIEALINAQEEVMDDVWLEHIYGQRGRVLNEVWLEKVTQRAGRFVFDSTELRAVIFKQSGVQVRHMKQ